MRRRTLARVTTAAGIPALGLGIGLAVTACGSATVPASPAARTAAVASAAPSGTRALGSPVPGSPASGTGTQAAQAAARSEPPASSPAAPSTAPSTAAPASSAAATPSSAVATPPSTAASSPPAATATATPIPVDPTFVVWSCENKPEVRPASYVLACADGNDRLAGLHWSSWTPGGASGTGVQYVNDCEPNCAMGHFGSYPADVTLSGGYRAGPGEPVAYTTITLTFTGPRPARYVRVNGQVKATYPATWSQALPVYRPAG